MRSTPRGYSLIEILLGLALVSIVIGIAYGFFHALMAGKSRSNVTNITRRSFLQMDVKSGLRRVMYRLRESTQILSPFPGTASDILVFRDITNSEIRLRRLPGENRLITERLEGGSWVRETRPNVVATGSGELPASWPVTLQGVVSLRFTVLSPDCVTVQASLELEGQVQPLLTVVKLRNSGLAQ